MPHLFSTTIPAVGLDISEGSVKMMQLVNHRGGYSVKGFSAVPLAKGLISNDTITDLNAFSVMLKRNLQKVQFGGFTTRNAVVSIPESKSFVRVIQIPKMSDAEAANAIPFEAESFIPLPVEQVYLDWQKLSVVEDKMNILIAAAPKEYIDAYLTALEKADVVPVALEVESLSCHRALIPPGSQETLLLVDIDAVRSNLVMIEDGNVQFTSSIPIAGTTFTESIARALGISSAKAEAIKKKVGVSNTPEYPNVKTALVPVLNNLSAEIKNILKFHNDHSTRTVGKIVLVGGGAQLLNLVEFLRLEFADFPGLAIETGNPWQNVKLAGQSPIDPHDSLTFTTAIGLALRGAAYEID